MEIQLWHGEIRMCLRHAADKKRVFRLIFGVSIDEELIEMVRYPVCQGFMTDLSGGGIYHHLHYRIFVHSHSDAVEAQEDVHGSKAGAFVAVVEAMAGSNRYCVEGGYIEQVVAQTVSNAILDPPIMPSRSLSPASPARPTPVSSRTSS
jgi:hypothetical protein